MPTNKPRVSLALPEDLLKQIDEFRYSNRIKNQTQAIITLLNRGFDAMAENETGEKRFTMDELQLVEEYRAAPKEIKQATHNILWPYIELDQ